MAIVDVRILGNNYTISCDDTEKNDLSLVVEKLRNKIYEVESLSNRRKVDHIIIMAAINLLYDFMQKNRGLEDQVDGMLHKMLRFENKD